VIRLAISAIIGIGIFSGQLCLAAFARALAPPWTPMRLLAQVLSSPWLYLATVCYVVAISLYLWLLRTGAISATNLPIMAIVVALNIAFAFTPGEALKGIQIAGAALVGLGMLLMQQS
jgi:drug/metabolite transporter (DMT)-like permease